TLLKRADLQACLRESAQSGAPEEAQRLRQQVQDSELAHQQGVALLQALRTMSAYQASASSGTTVGAALTRISSDREELLKVQGDLEALRQRIREHEKQGWTLGRLTALTREAGIGPSDVSQESVRSLNDALGKQRAQYLTDLAKSRDDRQK